MPVGFMNAYHQNIAVVNKIIMKNRTGLTFIEILLYISILSVMVTALIIFVLTIISGGVKNGVQQEVYSQARYISERIKYEIRNASGILSVSSNSISLSTFDPATNPTIIDLSLGNIRIKQGSSTQVNLNSSLVTIPSLIFISYSSVDNKTKHIKFSFIINSNYNSTRQEYYLSIPIDGGAEIRSN